MTRERVFIQQWIRLVLIKRGSRRLWPLCYVIWILWLIIFESVIGLILGSMIISSFLLDTCFLLSRSRESSFIHGRPLCSRKLHRGLGAFPFTGYSCWGYIVGLVLFVMLIVNINIFVITTAKISIAFALTVLIAMLAMRSKNVTSFAVITGSLSLCSGAIGYLVRAAIIKAITDPTTGIIAVAPLKLAEQGLFILVGSAVITLCSIPFTERWLIRLTGPMLLVMGVIVGARTPLAPVVVPTVSLSQPVAIEAETETAFSSDKEPVIRMATELSLKANSPHLPLLIAASTVVRDGQTQEATVSGASMYSPCFSEMELSRGVITRMFRGFHLEGKAPECGKPTISYSAPKVQNEPPNLLLNFAALRPVVDYIKPLPHSSGVFISKLWDIKITKDSSPGHCWLSIVDNTRHTTLTALHTESQYPLLLTAPTLSKRSLYLLLNNTTKRVSIIGDRGNNDTRVSQPTVSCDVIQHSEHYSLARVSFVIDGVVQVSTSTTSSLTLEGN